MYSVSLSLLLKSCILDKLPLSAFLMNTIWNNGPFCHAKAMASLVSVTTVMVYNGNVRYFGRRPIFSHDIFVAKNIPSSGQFKLKSDLFRPYYLWLKHLFIKMESRIIFGQQLSGFLQNAPRNMNPSEMGSLYVEGRLLHWSPYLAGLGV